MPENGTVAYVHSLPLCDICKYEGTEGQKLSPNTALFDLRTKHGPWAMVCSEHRYTHQMHEELGIGKGQMLVVKT